MSTPKSQTMYDFSDTDILGHIAALRTVLMTYHTQYPALGYVQGMALSLPRQANAHSQECPTY